MIKRADLSRDYAAHREEYLQAITKVCEETAFSGGKYADRFADEFADYLGVAAATGVNNGTSALHLAMLALGIGPGDEVIIPANTFIATAWGATYCGATPVFVDCTADTWEIDPAKIEEKITERTKAIAGVHLYGQPFDFAAVKDIADRHGLFTIEDCAQSVAAEFEGKRTGGLCDIGCFSFYPGKNLYAFGEGGAVTSNNPELIEKINVLKEHGSSRRYYHDCVGYNMRLEGIQGAVLSVSLKYLDGWTDRRIEIGRRYEREIDNPLFKLQVHPENTKAVYHLFEVQVPDPEHFLTYMKEHDIECTRHYPVPCHLQNAYAGLGYKEGDCPNAEQLAARCADLPLYPELTDDEVSRIIDRCNAYRG
ncbi:MAG: DegT/DnrJ/EryC1/StrS family aminotransferase [Lachnospiraceae bacterium]|nr:DegT/DnrJ/EryC1/StrS family aminotransferase [Lachnospiraceae bacterium]